MKNKSLHGLALSIIAVAAMTSFCTYADPAAGSAPTLTAEDQLAQQARYWEARGRYDLARESWDKLLRTSPNDPAALAGLAMAEAQGGHSDGAQVYLDRLKQSHPNSPEIPRIEEAIRQGSFDQDRLATPRGFAREGKYDDAVTAYKKIFGSKIPGGRLGLEYYQTLAGTKGGWSEAHAGLEKLARENPSDGTYALALGQQLTYHEETRREGIEQLERLTSDRQVGPDARKSLQQAQGWLGAPAPVAAQGGGTPARAIGPTPGEIHGQEVRAAFELLNRNDLGDAEARFTEMLARSPNDPDSLGGMGIIRLRQERYPESREYLERATRASPGTAGRWREALASASFWEEVRQADAARKSGDLVTAEHGLRSAISRYPVQASREPSVESSLADILVQENHTEEAEGIYRRILRQRPDSVDAARGLIGVLAGTDRLQEALAIAGRFPEDQRDKLGSIGSLKAQYLRSQAEKAEAGGDNVRAEGLLKDALLLDPNNPFTRLDLAHIYAHENREREANTLIDGILVSNPDMPDALFVKAILEADQQAWLEGLLTMEKIPAASRTPAMDVLQRRLWVRYQTQRATLLAKQGYTRQAMIILAQVEPQSGDTPENLGAMAIAYADVGDEGHALRYIRESLARQPNPDPGLRLVYAGLLFKLNQDAEFEVVMEELLRNGNLTDEQNLDLANLRIGYRLRQADSVREQGDLGRAYDYLDPMLRVNPNDPRVLMGLARLYDDSKDYDRSLGIYERVLDRDPDNLDALKGGAGAAVALKKYDTADDLVARAQKLDPNNPRIYALAGRVARAEGDDGKALKLYQQALKLDQGGPASAAGADPGAPQLNLLDPGRNYASPGAPAAGLAPTAFHPAKGAAGRARAWPATTRLTAAGTGGFPGFTRLRGWGMSPYLGTDRPVAGRMPTAGPLRKVSTSGTDPYWQQPSRVIMTGDCPEPRVHRHHAAAATDCSPARVAHSPTSVHHRAKKKWAPVESERDVVDEPLTARATPLPRAYGPTPVYQVPRDGMPASGNYTETPVAPPAQGDYVPPVMAQGGSPIIRTAPLEDSPSLELSRRRPAADDRANLQKEIADLQSTNSGYVGGGLAGRSRGGVSGLGRLSDIEVPVEAALGAGQLGRLSVRATPVYLDAGTISGTNLAQFGALALVPSQSLRYSQNDAGVAVGLGYDNSTFHADIGSSPLGMRIVNLVGGIGWTPTFGRTTVGIDLSRRSVTDSLLSYAGALDPATGRNWGGVTRSGGRLDLSYDLGRYGIYANAGYHFYDGENVQTNTSYEGGAGLYIHAIERPQLKLTYGLNVTTFFYNHNLSFYSFGHGGYFSPQQYYSVGVPVTLEGATRRFSYQLTGALGLQAFKQDGAPLFPDDSGLQLEAQVAAGQNPALALGYPSHNSAGVGFQFLGHAEYLLDRNLTIGGDFGIDNAHDYNEAYASVYVRYWFSPQSHVAVPPHSISPYWDYRDPNR